MKQNSGTGVIILAIIQLSLIALRIFDVIQWPWAAVFLPVLIPVGFVALLLIVAMIAAVIKEVFRKM